MTDPIKVERDSLKELVAAYQKIHPDVEYRDALAAVAKLEVAEAARLIAEAEKKATLPGAEPLRIPALSRDNVRIKLSETRSILRDKAVKFQEAHPGMAYRDALAAVAKEPTVSAAKEPTVAPLVVDGELSARARRFQGTHPGVSFCDAVVISSGRARLKAKV